MIFKHKLYWGVLTAFAGLVLITLWMIFYRLGVNTLENWDEAFYAQVTREMIRRGEPIIMYWNGNTFTDKTPLQFWINSLIALALGLNEFSIRLVSAVSGLLVIAVTTWYSYKRFGFVPALFAWASLALNQVFMWRARSGNLDTLTALLFVAIVFLSLTKLNTKKSIALGVLLALIFLQRTMMLYFGLCIVGIALIYEKEPLGVRAAYLVTMFCFLSLTLLPWIKIGDLRGGPGYVSYFFFDSSHGATNIGTQFAHTEYFSFLYYSLQRRLVIPLLIGVGVALMAWRKKESAIMLFASFSLLFLLSFSEAHNNWYLVPAMPFWSVLIAQGVYAVLTFARQFKLQPAAAILMLIPLLYISYKTFTVNMYAIIRGGANEVEKETATYINRHSKPTDVIFRTDNAYPVTIYYADRKVLYDIQFTKDHIERLQAGEFQWIVGHTDTVQQFLTLGKKNGYTGPYATKQIENETVVKLCTHTPCTIKIDEVK
ncbi:MAG: glycosyltransferase family 39 protein [Candidatus Roizmanbacteria bacterium]|nr:glycosyltransferase family 39 protein [Candidatus Roizmanbacteria bacterium]